jgi:curli biogenesis system outer membrane secretion channel CsgG
MKSAALSITTALLLTGCVATAPKMGSESAKTTATGSAGGESSQGANLALEKCDSPMGTVSLTEDQEGDWYRVFTQEYKLGSTIQPLRLLIQQSNCFVVVERGRAFQNIERERALQRSGELRQNSSFGQGQLVSADYSITPEVLVSARDTSGGGGGIAGGRGRGAVALGLLGAIAGSFRTNEASTMLTIIDNRSGVQIAAAEGSSKNTDFNVGAALFGSSAGAVGGGYTNTPQGKVVIAAFTDAYNNIVKAIREYKPQKVKGQGLGTGGRLSVDGAQTNSAPKAAPAPTAAPPAAAPAPAASSKPSTSTKPAGQAGKAKK